MRGLPIVIMAAALLVGPSAALATNEVTVSELIEMAADLDGQEVTVEGELIGDYGDRDDGWTWTQLNGDTYVHEPIAEGGTPVGTNQGIGLRMPSTITDDLDDPGGYRSRGPIVRVTGIWKYHDPDRQGESYLEVESLSILEPGRSLHEGSNWLVVIIGILLGGSAAVAWVTRPAARGSRQTGSKGTPKKPDRTRL
jgi:hypothetical protein